MPSKKPPLWKCPRCGHRFVTRNLWHSCGRYRLADHFKGKDPAVRRTFDRLVAVARRFGRVTVYAQKTRIVIQARVRFVNGRARRTWFEAGLWLKRRAEHPRLTRVESLLPLGYVHYFRLTQPSDVDPRLVALVGEAHAIGRQEHPVSTPRRSTAKPD